MSYPEPQRPPTVGTPNRTSHEIRRDIEVQREELGRSVETLRARVGELTDWRRQVREHQREIAIGAAVIGFAIGVRLAFRRRSD